MVCLRWSGLRLLNQVPETALPHKEKPAFPRPVCFQFPPQIGCNGVMKGTNSLENWPLQKEVYIGGEVTLTWCWNQ